MSSCHSKGNKCVRDIVKEIIRAQNEVAERDHCDVSCERSIRDLLSPATSGNGNTTIPIILYCKDCKPFIASGMKHFNSTYKCIETPVFKAKKFVEGSDSCVKLELLKPVRPCNTDQSWRNHCDKKNVCDFLDNVSEFRSTGICVTLDLDCTCGITCLEPTDPMPLTESDFVETSHHHGDAAE